MHPPVFLINLDKSEDRLATSTAQLDALGFQFTRVSAVDGRTLGPAISEVYDRDVTQAFCGRSLTPGEIGCYLSHLEAAKKVLESGAPCGIVFEDDFEMIPEGPEIISQILRWLDENPTEWDLMNLSAQRTKIHTPLAPFEVGNFSCNLVRAHGFPVLAHCLMWSRAGAEKFVTQHDKVVTSVDDHFRHWLSKTNTGLSTVPRLVTQSTIASDITGDGPERRHYERTFGYALKKQRRLWTDRLRAYRHKYF